jgi:hypothetical protein
MMPIMRERVTLIQIMQRNRWRLGLADREKTSFIRIYGQHPGLGVVTRHRCPKGPARPPTGAYSGKHPGIWLDRQLVHPLDYVPRLASWISIWKASEGVRWDKDPTLHVSTFERAMYFQGFNEAIVCRAFPSTLSEAASRLFSNLPPQSINNWKTLKDKFVLHLHLTSSKRQLKSEFHLETIKQMKDESQREYITRFNNEVLEVRNVEPNLVLYFFVKGLKPCAFAKALVGEKPTSMDDLKARAKKWIRIKE